MKLQVLSDGAVMSGSNWTPDTWDWFPCPNCEFDITRTSKIKYKCPECGAVLKLKKGVQYYIKAEII